MDENLIKYRLDLVATERMLKESYDKLVVTLSGGALALSIAFLKDIVVLEKASGTLLLLISWFCFIASLAAILGALTFGIEAHRKAIYQVDDGTIYSAKPGGWHSKITKTFHRLAAILLLLGLIFISVFVYINVGGKNASGTTTTSTTKAGTIPATTTTTTPKAAP